MREFRSRNGRRPERIDSRDDACSGEIVYRICEHGYEVRSRGIDRQLDTADDLVLTDSSAVPRLGNDAARRRVDPNAKTCSPSSGGNR